MTASVGPEPSLSYWNVGSIEREREPKAVMLYANRIVGDFRNSSTPPES